MVIGGYSVFSNTIAQSYGFPYMSSTEKELYLNQFLYWLKYSSFPFYSNLYFLENPLPIHFFIHFTSKSSPFFWKGYNVCSDGFNVSITPAPKGSIGIFILFYLFFPFFYLKKESIPRKQGFLKYPAMKKPLNTLLLFSNFTFYFLYYFPKHLFYSGTPNS